MYYCNCMDATVNHTICKHIHLVVRYNLQLDCKHSENQEINDSTVSKENSPSFKQSLLQSLTKCRQDSLYEVKQRLLNKLSILTTQVSMCKDTHALLAVEKCISTATSACKLVSPCKFNTPTRQVPPNKNITPQRPFLSTKKKSRKPTVKFGKPSCHDKKLIYINLMNQSLYDPGREELLRSKLSSLNYNIMVILS